MKKSCAYADKGAGYYFYNEAHTGDVVWPPIIQRIRKKAQKVVGHPLNHCLINFYEDGTVGVGWHKDREDDIVKRSTIVTISLNATRVFEINYHKNSQKKYKQQSRPGVGTFYV